MKRRDFLNLGVMFSAAYVSARALLTGPTAFAADAKKADAAGGITEAQVLHEGTPSNLANFCENPDKQPNKFCPDWKTKPGHCKDCTFFNKDNSLATFKGKKYARCQLLTDPKKPQFVGEMNYCATFVKKT
jgi:hypothetical protein